MEQTSAQLNKCAYCGVVKDSVRMHSGIYECQLCWDWRKHLSGEARYWTTGITALFRNQHGIGPDLNDWMLWDSWGIKEEVETALVTMKKLRDRYEKLLREHNVWMCKCGHMKFLHTDNEGFCGVIDEEQEGADSFCECEKYEAK